MDALIAHRHIPRDSLDEEEAVEIRTVFSFLLQSYCLSRCPEERVPQRLKNAWMGARALPFGADIWSPFLKEGRLTPVVTAVPPEGLKEIIVELEQQGEWTNLNLPKSLVDAYLDKWFTRLSG